MSKYRFSEREDTAIVKFVADILRTLGFDNWNVGLSHRAPDPDEQWEDGAFASIEPVPHRRHAVIKVCDDFLQLGHTDILGALVHECCHLFFFGTKQVFDDLVLSRSLGIGETNAITMRAGHEEEMAVDQMAEAWSSIMQEWNDVQKHLHKITSQVERSVP